MRIKKYFYNIFFCINLFVFLTQANSYAQEKGDFLKADKLIRISVGYIKLKNYDHALKALGSAYRMAVRLDEPLSRSIILNEIADKYIILGMPESALGVSKEIKFSDIQAGILSKIAYKYAASGEYKKAARIARNIEDYFPRALLLYRITNDLTEVGSYELAIEMARAIAHSSSIVKKFIGVQIMDKIMTRKGEKKATRHLLLSFKEYDNPYNECRRLIDIAGRYFYPRRMYEHSKDILSRAIVIAQNVNSDSFRRDLLERIGGLYKEINDFEDKLYRDVSRN